MVLSTKKRKRTPKPRIPSELIAVESIVKSGSIRFRCHWQIYDFGDLETKRAPSWHNIRSKVFKFSAGSMEELLAAVHGAVLAAANTNGVKLEAGWRKFCPRCGRLMTISSDHECPDVGKHIAMMNDVRLGRIKTLDREKIDDTINAETKAQREEEIDSYTDGGEGE